MVMSDWWSKVDAYWEQLQGCICNFHPYYSRDHGDFEITAPGAEGACQIVRQQVKSSDPMDLAEKYRVERNYRSLISVFSETWFGAPESRSVMSYPGFSVMCTLCEGVDDDESEESDN